MHDAESPPTPSLHLHTARTKGWELLIGRCHEWHPLHKQAALLCAPPQLLWQQTSCWAGCKAANIPWSLHSEHLDHGFMKGESEIVGLPSFWGVFQRVNAEIKRERQTSVCNTRPPCSTSDRRSLSDLMVIMKKLTQTVFCFTVSSHGASPAAKTTTVDVVSHKTR